MNSVEQCFARRVSENLAACKDMFIGLSVFAVIMAGIVAFSIWIVNRSNTVTTTEDVGALIDATFANGLTHDTTAVRTSAGTFRVYGTFQTTAGHAADIRTYQNGDKRLCDRVADSCNNLVQ